MNPEPQRRGNNAGEQVQPSGSQSGHACSLVPPSTNPHGLGKSMIFDVYFQGKMAPRTPESGGLQGKYVTSNSTICPG
jgi:hypothetical protein